jgi:transglutaminase-like putative cysteine protease
MMDTLGESHFVDYHVPEIEAVLARLGEADDRTETAVNIYTYVRDEILLGASLVGIKASETLKAKKGFSQTKGNLMVALCRAAGIPARYRLMDYDEKKIYGIVDRVTFTVFPLLRLFTPGGRITHVIPQIQLRG